MANRISPLTNESRIYIVGGGPAGSLFALSLLHHARKRGIQPQISIFEKHGTHDSSSDSPCASCMHSCNYCAGGLSPRMLDELHNLGLQLPSDIVLDDISHINIYSHWKNIEIAVPPGRRMVCVYRGALPKDRENREKNFDAFLLDEAIKEGVRVLPADVRDISVTANAHPSIRYQALDSKTGDEEVSECDFLVIATGVNRPIGINPEMTPMVKALRKVLPKFIPPAVRETLIFELDLGANGDRFLQGQLNLLLQKADNLNIEMGSIMPKDRFITVAFIGIDAEKSTRHKKISEVIRNFLEIPHINRMLPGCPKNAPVACTCSPNIVVGTAKHPYGNRIALIGDLATSRLYKDGIRSAFETGSVLAKSIVESGLSEESLQQDYSHFLRHHAREQRYGRVVLGAVGFIFRHPSLSRIAYQSVLSERRTRLASERQLELLVWQLASGDKSYRSILFNFFKPKVIWSIFLHGVLATLRNWLTELMFGLRWKAIERVPTGIYLEEMETKIRNIEQRLDISIQNLPVIKMYSINIHATPERVFNELERFGDSKNSFLNPRFVTVSLTEGQANQVGSRIRYDISVPLLSFSMVLEACIPNRSLIYRVLDGFARDGVLVFDIEETSSPNACKLSILAAFQVQGESGIIQRGEGLILSRLFPTYIHDVLWNHALCVLKQAVEASE